MAISAPGTNPVVVRTAAEARTAVEQLVSNGADLVVQREPLARPISRSSMEARRRGVPVDGHVPFRVTPEEAAHAGQRTVEHPDALAAGCSTAALSQAETVRECSCRLRQPARGRRVPAPCFDTSACSTTAGIRPPARPPSTRIGETAMRGCATADLVAYHHVVHVEQVLADGSRMRLVPQEIDAIGGLARLRNDSGVSIDSSADHPAPAGKRSSRARGRCLAAGGDRRWGAIPSAGISLHVELNGWSRPASLRSRPCGPPPNPPRVRNLPIRVPSSPASSPIRVLPTPTPSRTSATRKRSARSSPMAGSIGELISTGFWRLLWR